MESTPFPQVRILYRPSPPRNHWKTDRSQNPCPQLDKINRKDKSNVEITGLKTIFPVIPPNNCRACVPLNFFCYFFGSMLYLALRKDAEPVIRLSQSCWFLYLDPGE